MGGGELSREEARSPHRRRAGDRVTFYCGLATADLAFVAADTRTTYPGLGGHVVDDVCRSKLRRLRGGWATGSGMHQWLDMVYTRIAALDAGDLDAIGAAVGALARSGEVDATLSALGGYREAVAARPPGERDRVGDLCVISATADGFQAATIEDRGTVRRVGAHLVYNSLAEVPPETMGELAAQSVARAAPTELDLLRQVARFFAAVYARCGPRGPMSDAVSIALMMRDEGRRVVHRHVAPMSSDRLAGLSNADLLSRIEVWYAP